MPRIAATPAADRPSSRKAFSPVASGCSQPGIVATSTPPGSRRPPRPCRPGAAMVLDGDLHRVSSGWWCRDRLHAQASANSSDGEIGMAVMEPGSPLGVLDRAANTAADGDDARLAGTRARCRAG